LRTVQGRSPGCLLILRLVARFYKLLADFIAQTEQVLRNLEAALRAAGAGLENVVNTMIYVVATEQHHLADVWSVVRGSGLRAKRHTSTVAGVPMLGYTGQLVEITAVAVMPASR
jgi:enamine deaminase RidA (YjgF/YER057c/UK114 family)